jgi:hypothetical protein
MVWVQTTNAQCEPHLPPQRQCGAMHPGARQSDTQCRVFSSIAGVHCRTLQCGAARPRLSEVVVRMRVPPRAPRHIVCPPHPASTLSMHPLHAPRWSACTPIHPARNHALDTHLACRSVRLCAHHGRGQADGDAGKRGRKQQRKRQKQVSSGCMHAGVGKRLGCPRRDMGSFSDRSHLDTAPWVALGICARPPSRSGFIHAQTTHVSHTLDSRVTKPPRVENEQESSQKHSQNNLGTISVMIACPTRRTLQPFTFSAAAPPVAAAGRPAAPAC